MDVKQLIEKKMGEIRQTVGKEKALVALSGGVDSSVVTVLAHRAISNQLMAVFIDNGLMREGEGEWVRDIFRQMGIPVAIHNAQKIFLKALSRRSFGGEMRWFSQIRHIWRLFQIAKGSYEYRDYVEDPEEKRAVIEKCFYKIVIPRLCEEYRAKYWLQGTILTDIEETQAGIKLQHNVRPDLYPEKYDLPQGIIPLKELRKDEVREAARALGLPPEISERPPFLGPGLAGRIVGEVTPARVKLVRKAHKIVEEEFFKVYRPFQVFPVLLNDRATGIKDGKRAFGQIIVIRSVESKDARVARASEYSWTFLKIARDRLLFEIPEVTRVLYDLTPKPPATIEYI